MFWNWKLIEMSKLKIAISPSLHFFFSLILKMDSCFFTHFFLFVYSEQICSKFRWLVESGHFPDVSYIIKPNQIFNRKSQNSWAHFLTIKRIRDGLGMQDHRFEFQHSQGFFLVTFVREGKNIPPLSNLYNFN